MAPEVLVLGALHLDVVVEAPHLPARDETVAGSAVAYRFGGKGGNQAVAAARMGARAAMAGRVGNDQFGTQILLALDAAGVDRSGVTVTEGASGMSVAIVDAAGDYGAVIVSGVNREIDGEAVAIPAGLRLVLLQNEIPEAANLALASRLPPEVKLILNAAPARPADPMLLARTDILVLNRVEAEAMAGTPDPAEAAGRLLAEGPKTVIVTLGSDGLVAATAKDLLTRPAPKVRTVSSHGAGDAFIGALAADLARNAQLEHSLTFAQAAAALTVAISPDARENLTEEKVRTFLRAL